MKTLSMNQSKQRKPIKKLGLFAIFSSIPLSTAVLISWFVSYEPLLSIIPGSATMKVNTALIFLFAGICLSIHFYGNMKLEGLYFMLSALIGFIGLFTVFSYLGLNIINIDNFLIEDQFSNELPGRMSPATAFCGILLMLGLIGLKLKTGIMNIVGLHALRVTITISFIAIIAYFLVIPLAHRSIFFQSMAIHTSVLYTILGITALLQYETSILSRLLFQPLAGSKLFRKLLPIIVLFPVISSYLLLEGMAREMYYPDFGLAIFIILSIPITIIYLTFTATNLNKSDLRQIYYRNEIEKTNKYLQQFKDGLDAVSIVSLTDQKGIIKYVNEGFCNLSGFSSDELIGQTNAMVKSGFHSEDFFKALWKTIGSGKIWEGDIKNKTKGGEIFWVSAAIIPFEGEDGKPNEYLAIMQDITKRKQAEQLLKSQYVEKLQTKNKELEQFAYVASHDLQEPLNTVKSFIKLLTLKHQQHYDEQDKKIVSFISKATTRMSMLIKSLLDYSRIGKQSKLELIDCNELVKEVINDLDKRIKDNKAQISLNHLPNLEIYKTPFRSLIQNLIGNALKFHKVGEMPKIEISAIEKNNEWIFMVKDNGIGIPKKNQEKVFKIFQRLHNSKEYEGTGIGLAHCKKIVALHHGELWLKSEVSQGSTFYFSVHKNLSQHIENE